MNPLNAQQISRIEHNHSFKQASKKEPSKFLSITFKPFQFISRFFTSAKQSQSQIKSLVK